MYMLISLTAAFVIGTIIMKHTSDKANKKMNLIPIKLQTFIEG